MSNVTIPPVTMIRGAVVRDILERHRKPSIDLVGQAYLAHHQGRTVNPDSLFLKFPERPNARIIALPAHIGGTAPVTGLKWIASFPDNIAGGMPRASAVLILNDPQTGYPLACMDGAGISAARTAASAVLGARLLCHGLAPRKTVAFVGNGIISRTIFDYLLADDWRFDRVVLCDLEPSYSARFAKYIQAQAGDLPVTTTTDANQAVREADLVVLATTAPSPYLTDRQTFAHAPVVLNISLRDIGEEVILASDNLLDDVDHCLKQNTSPHLAEMAVGHRRFVSGAIGDALAGGLSLHDDRPRIFSPFGMGILDMALADLVYRQARAQGTATEIADFIDQQARWPD